MCKSRKEYYYYYIGGKEQTERGGINSQFEQQHSLGSTILPLNGTIRCEVVEDNYVETAKGNSSARDQSRCLRAVESQGTIGEEK